MEKDLATPNNPQGWFHSMTVRVLAIAFSVFAFIEVNTFTLPPFQERALFLMFPMALAFLVSKASNTSGRLLNHLLAVLSLVTCLYIVFEYDELIVRMGAPTSMDLIIGGLGMILVFEATRRTAGWALPAIAAVFVVYAYYGAYLPAALGGHAGYDFNRIITQSFLTMEGIFGVALSVMFIYVFPFVLFGVVLEAIGGLAFAVDLGQALFGRFRGGPAKVAVVTSGLVGMISGSAVANVVTAGSLTIPMMNRIGFQPHVSGAIEAVASTGGQLMPPVMGAAAFMMAEFLGMPYLSIAKAALIPAALYYVALFAVIHFYAVRHDIGGLRPSEDSPRISTLLFRAELYLFTIPVSCLIALMASGYSTTKSVSYAIGAAFLTSLFFRQRRLGPRRILRVLEKAARDSVSLTCASACVGIVIGLTLVTALGARFTSIITELAGGNVIGALILVMFSSIILGMGLPTTVCYVLLATLAAPALVNLGIPPLAAHMFILYFGMMSMVTPPDAMAAYAGAAIAGADMLKTGFTAWVFSLAGYLLPFMFILNPPLLMSGSVGEILFSLLTGTIGVIALGAAVAGHIKLSLRIWERATLILAAVAFVAPGWLTAVLGLLLLTPVLVRQYKPVSIAEPALPRR